MTNTRTTVNAPGTMTSNLRSGGVLVWKFVI